MTISFFATVTNTLISVRERLLHRSALSALRVTFWSQQLKIARKETSKDVLSTQDRALALVVKKALFFLVISVSFCQRSIVIQTQSLLMDQT